MDDEYWRMETQYIGEHEIIRVLHIKIFIFKLQIYKLINGSVKWINNGNNLSQIGQDLYSLSQQPSIFHSHT